MVLISASTLVLPAGDFWGLARKNHPLGEAIRKFVSDAGLAVQPIASPPGTGT
jgi:hypothetical protein